ncbi:MAG: SPOR domain-containing protein [Rhizobiaceae bacterium]|nr:SPOR domain-containing protein [Rhizobiaceae bacterium]
MSEKINPEVDQTADQAVEDDPLAELARIVAGEPEPVLETSEVYTPDQEMVATEPYHEPSSSDPAVEYEHVDAEMDMEAALTEALAAVDPEPIAEEQYMAEEEYAPHSYSDLGQEPEQSYSDPEPEYISTEASEPVAEPVLSVREEITRAVDQVVNHEVTPAYSEQHHFEEPVAKDVAYEEPVSAQHFEASQGASFEDGLISALESELSPDPVVEPSPIGEQYSVADDPVEGVASDEVAALDSQTDFESLENALAAELQDEVISTPQQSQEAVQQMHEQFHAETAFELPQEIEEDMATQPGVVEPQHDAGHSVDEDLGAAFANEFEQMLAQDSPIGQETSELGDFAEQMSQAQAPEQNAGLTAAAVATAASASDGPKTLQELDFGSAFAEELGVEEVSEINGWEDGATEAAQAEFSDALQHGELPADYGDPGHSGEIPAVPTEAMVHSEANEQKSGSSLKYAMAALVIALFAGTIFAGYGFLGGEGADDGGEPQVIKAETDPIKEKPEDPGGRVVANQDKASYEKVEGNEDAGAAQESLISNTEEPAEIISTGVNDGPTETPTVETNLAEKTDERLTGGGEADEGEAAPTANSEVTPRVVQTVTVKPDGTIVQSAPSVPKVAEAVTGAATELASNTLATVEDATTNLTETLRLEPKPVETEVIKKPESIDGARSTGNTAVPVASPLPKPVVKQEPKPVQTAAVKPAEPATPAAVRKSEWVVQVSSQRSPEAAQASFQNLRNRFGLLQGRPMSIQRANVNGATFYRVRVQTSSRNDANQLCTNLKAAGGSCFVTR